MKILNFWKTPESSQFVASYSVIPLCQLSRKFSSINKKINNSTATAKLCVLLLAAASVRTRSNYLHALPATRNETNQKSRFFTSWSHLVNPSELLPLLFHLASSLGSFSRWCCDCFKMAIIVEGANWLSTQASNIKGTVV